MQRGLGGALAAVAAGGPGGDDAMLAGAGAGLDPRCHSPEQERRPVEAAAVLIAIAGEAGGAIECRPEKLGCDQSVLGGEIRIRRPARCENGTLRMTLKRPNED